MLALALLLAAADPRIVPAPDAAPGPAPIELHYRGRTYSLEHDTRVPPARSGELRAPPRATAAREVGTPTTLFVNFDGITLSDCNPSDAKRNCHWYNDGVEFAPFSGSLQTRVSVLQAMRRVVSELGIRVTAVRPPDDEPYTMVIYGGSEEDFGVLGSAPAGDCYDQLPDEIGFAHIDGDLVDWVSGGATTALHEAGHTWGLDHIDVDSGIMYPEGTNIPTGFRQECDGIIFGTEPLPSCPAINQDLCGVDDRQNDRATLEMNFGPPYVDSTAPTITLVEPEDGQYFQEPGTFDVVLDIADDLHPQVYEMRAWLGDDPRPASGTPAVAPGFTIRDLPVGSYAIHVAITDEAGNESTLDFEVDVGLDPPPVEQEDDAGEGCACRARARGGVSALPLLVWLVLPALARRRVRR
jgi:hypothetical protein